MEVCDYNGEGRWSASEIRSRYAQYARDEQVAPRHLAPTEYTSGDRRWVYPVMDEIIAGIAAGDPACLRIGIEFIEEDQSFPFGRILKSKTARALRRAPLSEAQQRRVLQRVFDMLERGYIPREYREYARLACRIGFTVADLPSVDESNQYVMRYFKYFLTNAGKAAGRS